ncbi:MAG: RNA polymerase sigma factor, partial [Clostridia bacterium]|nr:RNA polymerase sigma factor [Clostridia bacterium]
MDIEKERIGRLIEQIQRGDKDAFEELYRLTSPKAYFVALQIVRNEQDAEDILQETYIKVHEKISGIDPSQSFMGWLYRVVSNMSKNLLKKRNTLVFEVYENESFEEIPDDTTEFSPEESLNQEEACREVMAAIDELTDEKRVCIVMKYFGEMTVREIAEILEVPEGTVKNRLYTARKDLKEKLEKSGNILHGAAIGGLLVWALNKTSVSASAAFLASAASTEIAAGAAAASATGTTATATTAASAGVGAAAKIAAVSVAQKIAVGVAATAVIGGSTVGVVTVVRNKNSTD